MIAHVLLAASMVLDSSGEGSCGPKGGGVPLEVEVSGYKDRRGRLRIELYPDTDGDFLADDEKLVAAGKAFRRVDVPTPQAPQVSLCII